MLLAVLSPLKALATNPCSHPLEETRGNFTVASLEKRLKTGSMHLEKTSQYHKNNNFG